MPLDVDLVWMAAEKSRRLEDAAPEEIVRVALRHEPAMVSSFGASSAALLHIVSRVDPSLPVIVLDTEMLFPETSDYIETLGAHLGLRDVRRIAPDRDALFEADPDGVLHRTDPRACCALRKRAPLDEALGSFGSWLTGRRRFQTDARAAMPVVEAEDGRLKFNPLAGWAEGQAAAYIAEHDLPRHPLVARGFRSIGCAPCTTAVGAGEDARAGRWRGTDKIACEIHEGDRA